MFKTTTSLALLGTGSVSVSASATYPSIRSATVSVTGNAANAEELLAGIRAKTGIKNLAAQGSPATAAQIGSSAAVSGSWATRTYGMSCSSAQLLVESYRMGYCAMDDATGGSNIYTCTEDSSTGDIVLSTTSYTDSACSTGATEEPVLSFSNSCFSGQTVSCSTSSNYGADFSDGGLLMTEYASSSLCLSASESEVATYLGLKGCIGGIFLGEESMSFYQTSDCTGSVVQSYPYSILPNCFLNDDDDVW